MARRSRLVMLIGALTVALCGCSGSEAVPRAPQGEGGEGQANAASPYDLVEDWLKPVEQGMLIHPVSMYAETPDRVFIGIVGVTPKATAPPTLGAFDHTVPGAKVDHQLFVVNRNGEITERWSQWEGRIGSLHEVAMSPYDSEKHLWVTDRNAQQVLKFSNDGKRIVMELGTRGVSGKDETHFAQPSDIAWLPDGTFFVLDGDRQTTGMQGRKATHVNTRVVKFDKDGKYLLAWDTGTPDQNLHGMGVDAQRRVYVAERGAGGTRLLIYDENGKKLNAWEVESIERPWLSRDGFVWIGTGDGMAKYDLNGKRLDYFDLDGDTGNLPLLGEAMTKAGAKSSPHDWYVDCELNLYTSPSGHHVIHKYTPKKDADPRRLMQPRVGECGNP